MNDTIVIAGAGHAAGQTVASLRQNGFAGRIVLIGDEPYLPYQRPPLSKKFLAGELELDRLFLRHEKFYEEHAVELRLGTRVERLDASGHAVILSEGTRLPYDKLVLATGSQVRRVDLPGAGLEGIHYLRTIADVEAIRPAFQPGRRLVVVGAGYIGLEVAAVAATRGLSVTVLEMADRAMSRVVSAPVSAFYEREHRRAGVDIRCGTGVAGFEGDGRVSGVKTSAGAIVEADLVIVGVGVLPTIDVAAEAGLKCDNGILVDEHARTSDPDIFAAGDCTNHPNRLLGGRLRLESVHNAQEQAKTVAANLTGNAAIYADIPWFWSDQYDLKLQIVGISSRDDEVVVRGDQDSRAFAVFYLRDGQLRATDAINSPREFMLSKKLVAAAARIEPARLKDQSVPFKQIAEEALA